MAATDITPPTITLGIDVSHFQGVVGWTKVAAAGNVFAYTKATDGLTGSDPRFDSNWHGIADAGLVRGAYHFFRPEHDAGAQVSHFASVVGAIDPGDLPPVLDIEEAPSHGVDTWDAVPAPQRVPMILAWLQAAEATMGRRPMIYTRQSFVAAKLPNAEPLGEYPLWVVFYRALTIPALPSPWKDWVLWQYSGSGTADGIAGQVDLNRFQGSTDDLAAFTNPGVPGGS